MRAETISPPNVMHQLPPVLVEAKLLELFSPPCVPTSPPRNKHANLWRADAIHRAKNLAQMAMSLAGLADHPSRRWLPPEVTMQARHLSRAYKELGTDDAAQVPVPCAVLLTEITSRLAEIFGRSRQVAVVISVEAVRLAPDVRRALVLIASELVINALKYGFSSGAGGTIMVSLAAKDGKVELIVEDDGIGRVETYCAGQGGGLLEQLGAVLGATVTRTAGAKGHGFRVLTSVPLDLSPGDHA